MYQLPAVMDRTTAATIREDLLELLAAGGAMDIDASKVERASSVGLQLIVSLKMQADEEKRDVVIVNATDTFRDTVKSLGLVKFLDVME
jgi:anti-anti-sigma factor